jgi:glycerol-3-phosphate dehydrogenase
MNPIESPGPDTKRADAFTRLTEAPLDLLIIGGGIVGSGVARDAAMRGLRVALVDQHDFAAGTSSRSSRLLHGGLRYLEQGRVGLVREASVEKKTIQRIAPHLAKPMGFIFPSYRYKGRPMWQLRIGVKIYDLLCSGRNFEPSRGYSRAQIQKMLPALEEKNLAGAVQYYDALTNDSRLVFDTLRSAERAGAVLLNYTRFQDAQRDADAWVCQLEDRAGGKSLQIRARTIVNATGPWADKVPHSGVKLRLSKGVHIVIDRSRLHVPTPVVITQRSTAC